MPFGNPSDTEIAGILARTRTIALVGWSADPTRPSHGVARYLASAGYRVIPVNPGLAGRPALSGAVVASLSDIPADAGVEMVDIFRRSSEVGKVVDEALACLPELRVIWTQLGVRDDAAAARAMRAGVAVVQDRCPAIERPRLLGS
ncbi:MAG: CoA-binding protein [Pseudomonadota bacterium]|jgi:predicted CoA-binding protein